MLLGMVPSRPGDPVGAFFDAVSDDDEDANQGVRAGVLREGLLVADRYKLFERIARGGMATIWEADDKKLGRLVAIKFLGQAYSSDPEYRFRFEEEARAAARLNTPYVVQTHDHGVYEGTPFIVMERLHGEDLHALLQRERRLPVALLEKIAREGGKALKIAHAAGIVHRDLKPKNLFLAETDDGQTLKLLDFGVAKHAGTAALMTATGVMLGSPYYMSPEQVRCERNLDLRTDLWSFAAILYRAATGVKAFDGDLTGVMLQITRDRPPPPSELCPDLPPVLDVFFERALAQAREDRFQSAAEMSDAFLRAIKETSGVRMIAPEARSAGASEAPRPEGNHGTFVMRGSGAPRSMPPPDAEHLPIPSDHPTFAIPVATMDALGHESALVADTSARRFPMQGRADSSNPGDRRTMPNTWQASEPLTMEQQDGFSAVDSVGFDLRWHGWHCRTPRFDASRALRPQTLCARRRHRDRGGVRDHDHAHLPAPLIDVLRGSKCAADLAPLPLEFRLTRLFATVRGAACRRAFKTAEDLANVVATARRR